MQRKTLTRKDLLILVAGLLAGAGLGLFLFFGLGLWTSRAQSSALLAGKALTSSPVVGAVAPDFELLDLSGQSVRLNDLRGRPVLLNFWATWCGPCLREIPMLKELQAARPDLQVVGIAIDKPDLVAKFAGDMQFNYEILVGQNEAWGAASALGVNIFALPFTVFTAGDGSILGVHTGELHAEHLEAFRDAADELKAGRIDVAEARRRIAAAI
jgi:thiol-disulfide isomerase/thioredoxin